MKCNNRKAMQKFYETFKETIDREFKHYKRKFGFMGLYTYEVAETMYKYGCFDIYDYDSYLTLVECGIDTKAVTEYTKVLDGGCTYKHRENLRQAYVSLVYHTLDAYNDNKLDVKAVINNG